MGENEAEPLAKTRTRRSNAGARMHQMMFAAEDDELFAQTCGLLKADEDSSEDEEYVPKDLDNKNGDKDADCDDDDADGDDDDSSGSDDDDSSNSDEEDEDEEDDENDEEEHDDGDKDNIRTIKKEPLNNHSPTHRNNSDDIKNDFRQHSGIKQDGSPIKKAINNTGSPSKLAYESCIKICTVCLGDQSEEDNEVIECDGCGVSVHESCYGVPENDEADETHSVHSNISSESTEPWFCEPCKRAVKNPHCELCPNTGGIFKQTDTGRWVHMVCALYTRGVTFEDVQTLSEVSLFELNYALYGSKACTICEDRRLARSGICIGCDAGLCKTFFHATCAQKEGLLFESHSDEVDPYFAQCKQHADKSVIRKKKRICTALFARLRRLQPMDSCSERIKSKLNEITKEPNPNLTKWAPNNPPPIPQRVGRSLMTSPSLIIRLTKKSELMGLDPKSAFMSVQDEIEMARQKWHIPPAFSLEFVAYCKDRANRMVTMTKNNKELVHQNAALKEQEFTLREKYNSIKSLVDNLRHSNEALVREARAIQKLVAASTGKQFNLPLHMEQLIARRANTTKSKDCDNKSNVANKTSSTHECGKCRSIKDQHLLALCDTCNSFFHIYCLDPPLTRVPKKTKFGGWQCSDCSERDEEEQEEAIEEQNTLAIQEAEGPRKLRERIKYPEKYCHESMLMADFWSASKRKAKRLNKKSKKPKVENKD